MQPDQIRQSAQSNWKEVQDIRRHLHAHPELSFEEYKSSEYLKQTLDKWGIDYTSGWVKTGLVVELDGEQNSQQHIALRADMDALPISEKNDTSYRSSNDGMMHACGHDAHSAMLLGALKILHENKSQWGGKVRALFQPGEEKLPGGASLMIKEGALGTPLPDAIVAQHVFPELTAGKVGFREGMYMASTDELYFTIEGKGGHGAMPHKCIDPIWVASQVITALQQVSSRLAPPATPTVLSIGRIEGLGATNVIPSEVKMEGTFRTFNETWREKAHAHIEEIAQGICSSFGATLQIDIRKGYPVLHNDPAFTQRCRVRAEALLGKENVVDLPIRATAEDFAYYTQHMPGCFYRLGTAGANGDHSFPVHHPQFDIDEKSLEVGMAMLAGMV